MNLWNFLKRFKESLLTNDLQLSNKLNFCFSNIKTLQAWLLLLLEFSMYPIALSFYRSKMILDRQIILDGSKLDFSGLVCIMTTCRK